MASRGLRILLGGLLLWSLAGCGGAAEGAKAPSKSAGADSQQRLSKLAQQNEKLLEQNQELADELQAIRDLRQTDRKEFERRLMAMEQTIRLMEQNLTQDPTANASPAPKPALARKQVTPPQAPQPEPQPSAQRLKLPTMDPLPPGAQIPKPESKVFVVPKVEQKQAQAQAAQPRPQGPPVAPLKDAEPQPEDVPTPENSAAIESGPIKPKGPKVIPSVAAQLNQAEQAEVPEKLSVQEGEIWEDPDLNPPVSPIKLTVFPAAKRDYNEAFKTYTRKDYHQATEQFDFFLSRYPNDIDADNAQFWRGMAFYDMGRLDEAEEEFRKVLKNYEHGETRRGFKTPDSVLMLAKIYLKRKKPIRARYYFNWILEHYPKSRSAAKARRELDAMGGLEAR